MKTKIAILGLGQIGASVGLKLGENVSDFERVGFDPKTSLLKTALKEGVIDSIEKNVKEAVADAEVILLALSLEDTADLLPLFSTKIRPNAIVLCTAPALGLCERWAGEHFPETVSLVGFTPMISHKYIESLENGYQAARADLFEKGLIAIGAGKLASPRAVSFCSEFANILGAEAFFTDPAEADGFMAQAHIFAQIIAASFLHSSAQRSSWRDGKKFAGRPFAVSTSMIDFQDPPKSLALAAIHNKEVLMAASRDLIAQLEDLQSLLYQQDEKGLIQYFEKARLARAHWIHEKVSGNWSGDEHPRFEEEMNKRRWGGNLMNRRGA